MTVIYDSTLSPLSIRAKIVCLFLTEHSALRDNMVPCRLNSYGLILGNFDLKKVPLKVMSRPLASSPQTDIAQMQAKLWAVKVCGQKRF